MALKDKENNYLKAAVLESINMIHKKAYIRIYQYKTEEQRQEDYSNIDENFCVQEVDISSSMNDVFQKSAYEMLKNHKVKTGENITPAEYDNNGELVSEEIREDVFEFPYKDFTDC